LISKRGGNRHAGVSLGAQNAANSLGQASGSLLGGALFVWQMKAHLLTGALLVTVGLVIGWRTMETQREARLAQ
jgi:predicted MFS family arabinose efflux permease